MSKSEARIWDWMLLSVTTINNIKKSRNWMAENASALIVFNWTGEKWSCVSMQIKTLENIVRALNCTGLIRISLVWLDWGLSSGRRNSRIEIFKGLAVRNTQYYSKFANWKPPLTKSETKLSKCAARISCGIWVGAHCRAVVRQWFGCVLPVCFENLRLGLGYCK
jgi:hypothetical protein